MIVSLVFSATKRRSWWGILGLVSLTVAGATYWYLSIPRLNVILVTFDTTRADHFGAYGYQHGLTKGFDDFARRGVVFERAYAPAPVTLPSHATMLTGLYPPEHGLRVNGVGRLESHIPLLPEILSKHGYDTGAFVAAVVLDSQFGLDRGFDIYEDDLSKSKATNHSGERRRDGQHVMDAALSWLRQRTSRPFFCWIHLYDAHAPYDFRPDIFGQTFVHSPYDAGVAREIQQFERLTKFLKDRKIDTTTFVVVAGDHGEGLDDHMEVEHGMLVYNTTLHVPLVFAGPRDCQPGTRVPNAVSLVDLTPTLLDILRIPGPKHVSGRSLRAALNGKTTGSRDCYAEAESPFLYNHWSPLHAVISNRWKYIQTTRPELYDLENDPHEQTNLAESAAEEHRRMRNVLQAMQQAFVPAAAQNLKLSEKDRANLQSLGYLSGGNLTGAANDLKSAEILPDVKDMLLHLAQFEKAKNISMEGKLDESIATLKEIVSATNEFPAADLLLGDCLAQAGRFEEAVTTYRSALAKRPDFVKAHLSLGKVYSTQGRFEQAATEFREFIKQSPNAATCHFELGQVLTKMQRFDEAISEYREAIRVAPEFVVANIGLGELFAALGRSHDAQACFEQAIEFDPGSAAARAHLMTVLVHTGQYGKAIKHGRELVALDPKSFDARFNLGILLIAQGRPLDGISELREAHGLHPDDPRPLQQIQRAEAALKKGAR